MGFVSIKPYLPNNYSMAIYNEIHILTNNIMIHLIEYERKLINNILTLYLKRELNNDDIKNTQIITDSKFPNIILLIYNNEVIGSLTMNINYKKDIINSFIDNISYTFNHEIKKFPQ